jgi:P27 family predicted phage terminase small subunit
MGGRGSGGHNKKSQKQHILEGTYRRDRHGDAKTTRGKRRAAKSPSSKTLSAKHPVSKKQIPPAADVVTPLTCPAWFDDYARQEFQRVCQVLHDQGTLQDVNHATLEGYCAAYSRAVRAELKLNSGFEEEITLYSKTGDPYTVTKKKTEVSVAEKAWGQVKMFAVELGITAAKGKPEPEEKVTELEKVLREAERKPR